MPASPRASSALRGPHPPRRRWTTGTDSWVLLPLVGVVPALTLPTNGVGPRGHPRQQQVENELAQEPHGAADVYSDAILTSTSLSSSTSSRARRLGFQPSLVPANSIATDPCRTAASTGWADAMSA